MRGARFLTIADLDAVDAVELGRSWLEAFNRRDAEALTEIADAHIVFKPAGLPGDRGPYLGHDGLRQWIADVCAAGARQRVELVEARYERAGGLVIVGELVDHAGPNDRHTVLMSLRDGKVLAARACLSGVNEVEDIGCIPG